MQRLERDDSLPDEMQGTWVDAEDLSSELIIEGGDIVCYGSPVAHDYKEINHVDGATTVSLKVTNPDDEDAFERENITGLVITPEGEFHVYNVKFASRFVRR